MELYRVNIFSGKDKITQTLFAICLILIGLVEAVWGVRELYEFTGSQHYLYKITDSFFLSGTVFGLACNGFSRWLWDMLFLTSKNTRLHKVFLKIQVMSCHLYNVVVFFTQSAQNFECSPGRLPEDNRRMTEG